jgi:phosphatidylinositol phospholipase C delta
MAVSSAYSSHTRPPPHHRLLRRAANILSSNGQPIPALQEDIIFENDRTVSRSIGGSIRRRFQRAGNSIRRLSSSSSSTSIPTINRHYRSQSEVVRPRPDVPRSSSAPDKYSLDHYRPSVISQMSSECSTPHNELVSPSSLSSSNALDFTIPPLLALGTPMTKVSAKKQKKIIVRLDPDLGQISYESKKPWISEFYFLPPLSTPSQSAASSDREHQGVEVGIRR